MKRLAAISSAMKTHPSQKRKEPAGINKTAIPIVTPKANLTASLDRRDIDILFASVIGVSTPSSLPQPARSLQVLFDHLTLKRPGQSLRRCPESGSLAIEPQRACEFIQPANDTLTTVPKVVIPDDRRQAEFPFAGERLGIDDQPWLACGSEHIVAVQVLMNQYLLALSSSKTIESLQRRIEQFPFARAPGFFPRRRQVLSPAQRLVVQRREGLVHLDPQPGQQVEKHIEGFIGADAR